MHEWDGTTAGLIHDEQTELVAFLRSLPAKAWDHPSLCARWSVRDVVVHTAAHIHGAQQDRAVVEHYSNVPTDELIEYLASRPEERPDQPLRDRRLLAEVQRGELMIHHQDVRRAIVFLEVVVEVLWPYLATQSPAGRKLTAFSL
jgi:uncharacterized protein (TIGR03083 family)